MALGHARTGSDQRCRACFSSAGTLGGYAPAQMPVAKSRSPLKLTHPQGVPRQPGSLSQNPRAECAARLEGQRQGSPERAHLAEQSSPRMDWLGISAEVAPGPILDQLPLPHPGPDGDTPGQPPGAALSGTTADAAAPPLHSALLGSLPEDGLCLLSVALVWTGLGAQVLTQCRLWPQAYPPRRGSSQRPWVRCPALDQWTLGEQGQGYAGDQTHLAPRVRGGS